MVSILQIHVPGFQKGHVRIPKKPYAIFTNYFTCQLQKDINLSNQSNLRWLT